MTSLNTVFGAIVGAIPLLIGFSNNTGMVVLSEESLYMTSFLFLWQFAHFYGIYVAFKSDYEKTNFKFI